MRIKLFLLFTLLVVLPRISFATDYYIATTDLNVRSGAGARYPVTFTIQKGNEVELISKEGSWYKIKYLEKIGYSSSKYLKFRGTDRDTYSNTTRQWEDILPIVIYACLIVFICFKVYKRILNRKLLGSVTDKSRGTKSERDLVLKLLRVGIPEHYIFHDLYVEKRENEFAQTDLIVVTSVGIIVIEVKDYSGWIFGSGNQSQWTQVLAYGRQKYYFYNPIMQNNKHIAELKKKLYQFETIPFYSLVVFYGDCEFKSINFVPQGTYIVKSRRVLEVVANILRNNNRYSYTNENEVLRILREAVTNGGDSRIQTRHIENIKDMLGTDRIYE